MDNKCKIIIKITTEKKSDYYAGAVERAELLTQMAGKWGTGRGP